MRGIDGDRLLREIRKHKNRVIVGCKTKYFPLDLIRKIIREAPEIRICEKKGNTNADRLRSMTDEELGDFLTYYAHDGYMNPPCGWHEWLKQNAEED